MKLQDWSLRLSQYIALTRDTPFSYDPSVGLDCCTFTFGAIQAQLGRPIGLQFVGRYSTRKEALMLMKEYCGRPFLSPAISKVMREEGFSLTSFAFAQRGDAVLVPQAERDWFFGILDLNGRDVLSIGEGGIRRIPISIRCRAWRIA